MKLQKNTAEVKAEQTFWLYPERMAAWMIITLLILIMLSSIFRTIGRITWPAIFALFPFAYLLLSKKLLQKVYVTDGKIEVKLRGKTITEMTEFTVGVFERRTGRRVLPYTYIARDGFKVTDEVFKKVKVCTKDYLFISLIPNIAMKIYAFQKEGWRPDGTDGLNAKNTETMYVALKHADLLRKTLHA